MRAIRRASRPRSISRSARPRPWSAPVRDQARRLADRHRRAGLPRQGIGRLHRRPLGRDAGRCRRDLRDRRPFRAAPVSRRDRRGRVAPRPRRRTGPGSTAIVCVGETRDEREAGKTLAVVAQAAAGLGPGRLDGRQPRRRLRAGLGHRHRPDADGRRRRRGARASSARSSRRLVGKARAEPRSGFSTAARSSRRNAAELLAVANVDGALVGGASLVAADFLGHRRRAYRSAT